MKSALCLVALAATMVASTLIGEVQATDTVDGNKPTNDLDAEIADLNPEGKSYEEIMAMLVAAEMADGGANLDTTSGENEGSDRAVVMTLATLTKLIAWGWAKGSVTLKYCTSSAWAFSSCKIVYNHVTYTVK